MISPETFKNLAAGLLSVTTAVALPFLGIWISKAIKDREVQGKFVELSVSILRDKPLGDETKALREWAVKVINQYSGISLPDDLISKTRLPRYPLRSVKADGNSVLTQKDVEPRVRGILAEVLGVDRERVTLEESLEDLGADDGDRVDLIMACEEQFGVRVTDDERISFKTVGDIVAFFRQRLSPAAATPSVSKPPAATPSPKTP